MALPTWKPVQIDGNIFSNGANDLIGIEECTDYNVESVLKVGGKHKLKQSDERPLKKLKKNACATKIAPETFDIAPSKCGQTTPNRKKTFKDDVDENYDELLAWHYLGFPECILKALHELKFIQPTPIQSLTLPAAVLGRRDILGAAETGSGKTLAFGLPILSGIIEIRNKHRDSIARDQLQNSSDTESILEENENIDNSMGCVKTVNLDGDKKMPKSLQALILTPTRELAVQIKNHLDAVAKYSDISVAVVVGGMAAVKQERILTKSPEIVVATPGRLWELIQQGNEYLSQVQDIRYFVIDETDRMLERGHFQELHSLLEKINKNEAKRKQRQNFVFSATLTLVHELPKHLKMKKSKRVLEITPEQKLKKIVDMLGVTNPKVVDITGGKGTSTTLSECRITCAIHEKDYYVYYFLKRHSGRTIIFCNSIGCVKRLASLLSLLDCHPLALHASMKQKQRLKNLEKFRDVENSILIATDVAARGLDIPNVEHVLHYQTPRTSESYVHRSGRTARASREGITILFMEPNEFKSYINLCKTLKKSTDLPVFPVEDNYLNAVKQRVNLARELDVMQLQVKKVNSESSWFEKAAKEMDIVTDDFTSNFDSKEANKLKKTAELKKKQLAFLLASPIFPRGFIGKYALSSGISKLSNYLKQEDGESEYTAVETMKNAVQISAKDKKKKFRLYKPKRYAKEKPNAVQNNKKKSLVNKKK